MSQMICRLMNSMGADMANIVFEHGYSNGSNGVNEMPATQTLITVGGTMDFPITFTDGGDGWGFAFLSGGKWYSRGYDGSWGQQKDCNITNDDYNSGKPVIINFMPDGWSVDLPVSSNCANIPYDDATTDHTTNNAYFDDALPTFQAVEAWITSLYENILSRAPSATELQAPVAAYLKTAMSGPTGLSAYRASVVAKMFEGQEYCTNQIVSLYTRLLNRAPNSSEDQPAITDLESGTALQSFMARFCSSDEFIRDHPLPTAYTNEVYQLLLNRTPTSSELATTTSGLQAGTTTPAQVCTAIVSSSEFCNTLVNQMFQTFLNRLPTGIESATYVPMLTAGIALQIVSSNLPNSDEYLKNCTASAGG